MSLDEIIRKALSQRATDIHLEPSFPPIMRVNGTLKRFDSALSHTTISNEARRILNDREWETFETRGSVDICKSISGVQCRMNIMRTERGTGFAIRLLGTTVNTLKSCNLMPSLSDFLKHENGLILLVGPTGSGKTTTLSALIEEINQNETRHIITLENPIEYRVTPKKSIVRQREVGRHTSSFEQGLLDSLREDPDVLVVGEMRETEVMRLALNAAETGHLVLATMHSASASDAVYRMMMSFPPERQSSALAQIADTLVAIVSQRMTYRRDLDLLVPCLEILPATHAVRNVIRKGEVSKFISLLQAGGTDGLYTFDRYQTWIDSKTDWVYPEPPVASSAQEPDDFVETSPEEIMPAPLRPAQPPRRAYVPEPSPAKDLDDVIAREIAQGQTTSLIRSAKAPRKAERVRTKIDKDGRIEIPEVDLDLNELVKEFKGREE